MVNSEASQKRPITPNIVVDDAEQAVMFLKKAFGAPETYRSPITRFTWTWENGAASVQTTMPFIARDLLREMSSYRRESR
jgi:hypothetical protein